MSRSLTITAALVLDEEAAVYPGHHAALTPEKPAVVMSDSGAALTYAQLEERSIRLARVLHDAGLRPGDDVALLDENSLHTYEVFWAAMRSGLYLTAINHHLTLDEVAYIVRDCDAKALVVSARHGEIGRALPDEAPGLTVRLAIGPVEGFDDYEDALAASSSEPLPDQPRGKDMLYSSGTTGRPKGVKAPLPGVQVQDGGDALVGLFGPLYGFGADTVYLSPAPLYHAAPLRFGGMIHQVGGTVVVMPRFDAQAALAAIERHRVTHSQWVPTMFVRMLKLPDDVRGRFDLSSHRVAVHAAAPCPVEVKQQMIEWWGPILQEYYAATEAIGITVIDSPTWLRRPGSVGRSLLGTLRVCDDETVADLAVIGMPDPEMGEVVKAVVQPAAGVDPGPDLAAELLAFLARRVARYKVPRRVEFVDALPRTETGKLQKHQLRETVS